MTLKELREKRGFTLKELSKRSGIHVVQISKYEHEKMNLKNMSLKNAVKLADALGCRPEDFLDCIKK